MWKAARRELAERGGAIAAAISTQHWFESILIENGFALTQSIVLLEWEQQSIGPTPVPASVNLRPMRFDDLPGVTEVDAVAFDPLWRNSSAALGKAYSQAVYASIAEDASGLIGYQLSTGGSLGIHLARLAVRPEAQGRGLGVALGSDLIAHLQKSETSRVTVNTQADNAGSLALYRKLGFRLTGEQYPVYIYRVE